MNDNHLAEYLNNHLAGSVAGIEVTKRCIANNRESETAEYLQRLLADLEEDQEVTRRLISALGRYEDTLKKIGTWALMKFAEPKLATYSGSNRDFGRLVELEAILLGSRGRLGLWLIMEKIAKDDERMLFADFTRLRERAEDHCRELERLRVTAAEAAFV